MAAASPCEQFPLRYTLASLRTHMILPALSACCLRMPALCRVCPSLLHCGLRQLLNVHTCIYPHFQAVTRSRKGTQSVRSCHSLQLMPCTQYTLCLLYMPYTPQVLHMPAYSAILSPFACRTAATMGSAMPRVSKSCFGCAARCMSNSAIRGCRPASHRKPQPAALLQKGACPCLVVTI